MIPRRNIECRPRTEDYYDLFVKYADGTLSTSSWDTEDGAKMQLNNLRKYGIREATIYHEWAFLDPERKSAKMLHSVCVFHEFVLQSCVV